MKQEKFVQGEKMKMKNASLIDQSCVEVWKRVVGPGIQFHFFPAFSVDRLCVIHSVVCAHITWSGVSPFKLSLALLIVCDIRLNICECCCAERKSFLDIKDLSRLMRSLPTPLVSCSLFQPRSSLWPDNLQHMPYYNKPARHAQFCNLFDPGSRHILVQKYFFGISGCGHSQTRTSVWSFAFLGMQHHSRKMNVISPKPSTPFYKHDCHQPSIFEIKSQILTPWTAR